MKCCTVESSKVKPYISVIELPYPLITCGEEGRGRELGRIRVHLQEKTEKLESCSLFKSSKGVIIAVAEGKGNQEEAPTDALVKVAIHAGFRGGASYRQSDLRAIAEGHCAQGDAGRIGGHTEYIGVLPDKGIIVVSRGGRLYGGPERIEIRNIAGQVFAKTPEQWLEDEAMEEVEP